MRKQDVKNVKLPYSKAPKSYLSYYRAPFAEWELYRSENNYSVEDLTREDMDRARQTKNITFGNTS